jgi:competence protein ComEA
MGYRIDLNQADHSQLLQVPGIGDHTAEKIEAFRQEHGPFQKSSDLTQIRGIGPAKLEKVSDWLTVRSENVPKQDDPTTIITKPLKNSAPTRESIVRSPSKKEESLKKPIDVNRANSDELQKLPGIGPKMAQRILDERAKSPFRTVEDLRRVSGIGPKVLERLRPFVKVNQGVRQAVVEATDVKTTSKSTSETQNTP